MTPELAHAIDHCSDRKDEARLGKVSVTTVHKWRRMKAQAGHCAPKKTRVKTHWQDIWWLPLFMDSYRKPQKPKVTEAYAEFSKDWAANGLSLEDLPSYTAVVRLLAEIPPVVREIGRRSSSELAALKCHVRRDWSGSSNEVWVGDGHTFKAKVRHPQTGHAFAPEVTLIIDAASRYIVGWAYSLAENQIAVGEALGQGMLKYGKPLIYYSDNGSGQTAKTIDCPLGGMLARLGVVHETGRPGNPQGRGLIEGLWDITTIAVAKTYRTFQGTGMDDGATRKNRAAIDKARRKGEVPDFVPSWRQFMADVDARIDWYNTQHKHRSLGGKTPHEVYFASFDASWSCKLTEDEITNLYRPSKEATPRRGEVLWLNNIYFNPVLNALPKGTKVRMAYDLHDGSRVWISDLQGRFICEAKWDGNKRDGFEKSYVESLKDNRMNGIQKRAKDKAAEAEAERLEAIEGELTRIQLLKPEPVVPLIPVPFIRQQPEEEPVEQLKWLETIAKAKAIGGNRQE